MTNQKNYHQYSPLIVRPTFTFFNWDSMASLRSFLKTVNFILRPFLPKRIMKNDDYRIEFIFIVLFKI